MLSKHISKFYVSVIVRFITLCVAWARKRNRVVQYEIPAFCKYNGEHGSLCPCGVCLGYETGNVYMTRYVLFGHMTGDGLGAFEGRAARLWVKLKHYLPSVYVNCIHRHDHDNAVHNHPWPWAITFGLLGRYSEKRFDQQALEENPIGSRHIKYYARRSPFAYVLKRKHWHRICDAFPSTDVKGHRGVWTLFVAAPRVFSQPWGYLIDGRGYVDQRERHAEIGARETRGEGMLLPLSGRHLDRVAHMYGIERRRWLFVRESDARLRARCLDSFTRITNAADERPLGVTRWQYFGLRVRRAIGLPLWTKRGVRL